MRRGNNTIELKKLNRNKVFRYINGCEKTSVPEIANAVGLSVPTALQMVKELKISGLVEEVGEFQSTGGRKAKAVGSIESACYAIGIDITRNHIGMILTNLSQKILHHIRIRKTFRNEESYFKEIGDMLSVFVKDYDLPAGSLAGVGIAVPAIVDSSQNHISFSHALDMKDVSLEKYLSHIPYPCVVLNDAKAAVMTEYIDHKSSGNMVYLSLSNTVGGAIVMGMEHASNLFMGDNWRSGEFGHMTIHPEGRRCYCGKRGCLDAYCSALNLSKYTDGKLELFFNEMEQGNKDYQMIWEEYQKNLSLAVDNLRMSFDSDVVLGGYVGSQMKPYMKAFRGRVARKNIFGNTGEYVKECRYLTEASALGAALYHIEKFITNI